MAVKRCERCRLPESTCLCSFLTAVENPIELSIFMPAGELKKPSNTGRTVAQLLSNTRILLRGIKDQPLDFSALHDQKSRGVKQLILFPTAQARPLSELAPAIVDRPDSFHLIVPDGTWSQAGKIARILIKELNPQAVTFTPSAESAYLVRRAKREGTVCTIEAIAEFYRVVGLETIAALLLDRFRRQVQRILWSRHRAQPYPGDGNNQAIELRPPI